MAKCKDCKNYEINPDFKFGSSSTVYAICLKERDDIMEGDLDGVYQVVWEYDIKCSDFGIED